MGCQRNWGEHLEVGTTRALITDVHQLAGAQWHLLTLEGASTVVDEVRIGHMHGVHRTNTGVALTKTRGDRLTWGGRRQIGHCIGISEREVLLWQEVLTGEDVDVLFLGDLVHRLAVGIVGDFYGDDVVVRSQLLLGVVVRLADGGAIEWGVQGERVAVVVQRNTLLASVERVRIRRIRVVSG